MDERTRSVLLQVATFLDGYDDHAVLGIAAKKETSDLLNKIRAPQESPKSDSINAEVGSYPWRELHLVAQDR